MHNIEQKSLTLPKNPRKPHYIRMPANTRAQFVYVDQCIIGAENMEPDALGAKN